MYTLAVINRALPGSGKSTFARLLKKHAEEWGLACTIRSTDEKYMVNGVYIFDVNKIGYYHGENFKDFCKDVDDNVNIVIVDNTNLSEKDYKKYVDYIESKEGGKSLEVVFRPSKIEEHFERTTHKVPREVIENMFNKFSQNINFTYGKSDRFEIKPEDGYPESQVIENFIIGLLDNYFKKSIEIENIPRNKYEILLNELNDKGTGKMKGFGNSMLPIIKSGTMLTYVKNEDNEYEIGDIVFCKVRGRWIDAHKIIKKDVNKGYLIANNSGFENGWTKKIFGKVVL